MVVRHVLFAGLFAAASLANAGVVEPSLATAPAAAWSFTSGVVPQAAPSDAMQVMLAGPGKWTGHSRMGDRSATPTMLFTQRTYGAPTQAAIPSPVQNEPLAAAPAPAPTPVIDLPAVDAGAGASTGVVIDNSGLVNGGGSVGGGAGAGLDVGDADPAVVPEPSTGLLMLAGLLGAGALARRRRT